MDVDNDIVFNEKGKKIKIHPAIDMSLGVFYFGLQLPLLSVGETINKGLCFVASKKECFKATKENLDKRNLEIKVPAAVLPPNWELSDIEDYLHNNSQEDYSKLPEILYLELRKYIDLADPRAYILIALWIIGTYLQPIWYSYPYLSISGAKRCGKSKLLKFLSLICFNSIFSASISTSMIFRLIESLACTLLLDESEKYATSERQDEVRNIINAGYKKDGKVYRAGKTKSGTIIPEQFEAFSPKAIVSYKGLEEVTEDRCIPVIMVRSINKEIVNRDINPNDRIWINIRNQLYRFALDKCLDIEKIYKKQEIEVPHPDYMSRERDLWKPILTLAAYFNLENKIIPYIIDTIERKKELERSSLTYILLEALVSLVKQEGSYTNAEIRTAMTEKFEGGQLPTTITPAWIGSVLIRQFNIKEGKRKGTSRGYYLSPAIVRDLCIRYGVEFDQLIDKTKKEGVLIV
jgi:hypothetical protein